MFPGEPYSVIDIRDAAGGARLLEIPGSLASVLPLEVHCEDILPLSVPREEGS